MTATKPQLPVGARLVPHTALRHRVTASLERQISGCKVIWGPTLRDVFTEPASGGGHCLLELVVPVTAVKGHVLDLDTARLMGYLNTESSSVGLPVVYAAPLPPGPGPLSFRTEFMTPEPGRTGYRSMRRWMRIITPDDISAVAPALFDRPATRLPWPGTVRTRPWAEFWCAVAPHTFGSARRSAHQLSGSAGRNHMTALISTPTREMP